MCEATYNATMPFKWNATKVQVMPGGGGGAGLMASQVSHLSDVPTVPGTGLLSVTVPYRFRTLPLACQHFFRAVRRYIFPKKILRFKRYRVYATK
jgi:hypothetical protein